MARYAGKVALITGGGRGIGRATALRLGSEGAAVAVLDLDRTVAEEVAGALRKGGAKALALEADITNEAGIRGALARVGEDLGPLDVLVNNATRAEGQSRADRACGLVG